MGIVPNRNQYINAARFGRLLFHHAESELHVNFRYQAVGVENLGSSHAFLSLVVSWLFASLVSSGQAHAVAICGVGLQLRNRTNRFRFCAVAAR